MKTTAEKIKVMQAFERGEQIEAKMDEAPWVRSVDPSWDWTTFDYRVKPTKKPVAFSVLIGSGLDWEDVQGDMYGSKEIVSAKHAINLRAKPRMDWWFANLNFPDSDELVEKLKIAGFIVNDQFTGTFSIVGVQKDRCLPWEA